MISTILKRYDFMVRDCRRFYHRQAEEIERQALLDRHWMLGYLIGFTRQMDVSMRDDSM
jgi:hypothetical protein